MSRLPSGDTAAFPVHHDLILPSTEASHLPAPGTGVRSWQQSLDGRAGAREEAGESSAAPLEREALLGSLQLPRCLQPPGVGLGRGRARALVPLPRPARWGGTGQGS